MIHSEKKNLFFSHLVELFESFWFAVLCQVDVIRDGCLVVLGPIPHREKHVLESLISKYIRKQVSAGLNCHCSIMVNQLKDLISNQLKDLISNQLKDLISNQLKDLPCSPVNSLTDPIEELSKHHSTPKGVSGAHGFVATAGLGATELAH